MMPGRLAASGVKCGEQPLEYPHATPCHGAIHLASDHAAVENLFRLHRGGVNRVRIDASKPWKLLCGRFFRVMALAQGRGAVHWAGMLSPPTRRSMHSVVPE
jgi:hypothetical protein